MLIYVEGGPEIFAGKVFESELLLDHPEFKTDQYRYTSRTIPSSRFPGKVAQVWRHVSFSDPDPVLTGISPVPSAVDDSHAMASQAMTTEIAVEATPVTSSPAETGLNGADYTGAPVEVGDDGELPNGDQLYIRRKKLKISVQVASEATGLATSKIAAIEKGTGKRIKPGEVRALHDFLTAREGGGGETPRP